MPTMNAAEALLRPMLGSGRGDMPALLFADQTISYAELDRRASRAAHALRRAGLGRQDRVVMVVHDTPGFFEAYLGAMKAGGVPVALNLRLSAKDLAHVVADSGCTVLLLDAEFVPLWSSVEADVETPPMVLSVDEAVAGFDRLADLAAGEPDVFEPEPMAEDDMAFWMYTSGTTGAPKGVVHTQKTAALGGRFPAEVLKLRPGERIYCSSKLFFAFSLGHCLFGALACGAAVVLYEGWPSAEAVSGVVERFEPDVMLSVPTFYRNLVRDGFAERPCFRRVRAFVSAGEKLPRSLAEQWRDTTGTAILEGVGATENAYLFLSHRLDDCRAGLSGIAVPGTEVELRDQDGARSGDGPGTLWVRSETLAREYWHHAEKTAQAFQDGWYCTGDVFTRDSDGWFEHQGRADDMLKISGQWVSPAEIEAEARKVDGIDEAVVVGAPNADGLVRLVMFATAEPGSDARALKEAVPEYLKTRLSIYKCPRRVHLLDDLPRTSTGKVQRFVLREKALELV